MSLVWGQTAVFQSDSELVFLLTGGSAVGLACLGGAIISGLVTPRSIPDDELSPSQLVSSLCLRASVYLLSCSYVPSFESLFRCDSELVI